MVSLKQAAADNAVGEGWLFFVVYSHGSSAGIIALHKAVVGQLYFLCICVKS